MPLRTYLQYRSLNAHISVDGMAKTLFNNSIYRRDLCTGIFTISASLKISFLFVYGIVKFLARPFPS